MTRPPAQPAPACFRSVFRHLLLCFPQDTEDQALKIAVMGAGALGGYFGGRLAQAGHEVTLIARGAHLEALRRNPRMANLDIVVAANDEPRVPAIPGDRTSWTKTCTRWPGGRGSLPRTPGR